jgi:hypothetical protein
MQMCLYVPTLSAGHHDLRKWVYRWRLTRLGYGTHRALVMGNAAGAKIRLQGRGSEIRGSW